MLLGLMFTLPRYAGLGATQPANLGELVPRRTTGRKKRPLMSDWRHRGGRRSHPTQKEARLAPSAAGIAMPMAPSIAKQAGMFMFGRHAARHASPGHRGRSQLRPAHRS